MSILFNSLLVLALLTGARAYLAKQYPPYGPGQLPLEPPRHFCGYDVHKIKPYRHYEKVWNPYGGWINKGEGTVRYQEWGDSWAMVLFPYTDKAVQWVVKENTTIWVEYGLGKLHLQGTLVPFNTTGDDMDLNLDIWFSEEVPEGDCTCTEVAHKTTDIESVSKCNWDPEWFAKGIHANNWKNCAYCRASVDKWSKKSICKSAMEYFTLEEFPMDVADWVSYEKIEGGFSGPGLDYIRAKVQEHYPYLKSETCTLSVSDAGLPQTGCTNYDFLPKPDGWGGYAYGFGVNGANFNCGLQAFFTCEEDKHFVKKLGQINLEYRTCPPTMSPTDSPTQAPVTGAPSMTATTSPSGGGGVPTPAPNGGGVPTPAPNGGGVYGYKPRY